MIYLNLYGDFINYKNTLAFYFATITKDNTHAIIREIEKERKKEREWEKRGVKKEDEKICNSMRKIRAFFSVTLLSILFSCSIIYRIV